jgi:hypothetical protein
MRFLFWGVFFTSLSVGYPSSDPAETAYPPPLDITSDGSTFMFPNTKVVQQAMKEGKLVPQGDEDLLQTQYPNVVLELLKHGTDVDPSANDNEALMFACENGFVEMVKVLLQDPRVDPSARDNEAIRLACRKGYFEIVEALSESPRFHASADMNKEIVWASNNGHGEVVKSLLKNR